MALKPQQQMCQRLFSLLQRLFTFSGPFGLEKWYNQRVSVIKSVGDLSSTTAYPKKKRRDEFFSLIKSVALLGSFLQGGARGVGGRLSPEPPSTLLLGGHLLYHREVQPLGHSGGSFHLVRGPESQRVFQA